MAKIQPKQINKDGHYLYEISNYSIPTSGTSIIVTSELSSLIAQGKVQTSILPDLPVNLYETQEPLYFLDINGKKYQIKGWLQESGGVYYVTFHYFHESGLTAINFSNTPQYHNKKIILYCYIKYAFEEILFAGFNINSLYQSKINFNLMPHDNYIGNVNYERLTTTQVQIKKGLVCALNRNKVDGFEIFQDETIDLTNEVGLTGSINGVLQTGNGTGTISSTGTAVTGTGTDFSNEFVVGDVLWANSLSEGRRIINIIGTSITLESAFSSDVTNDTFKNGGLAPNTWFYLWIFINGQTNDLKYVASTRYEDIGGVISPFDDILPETFPSNSLIRRVGAIFVNGSNIIRDFKFISISDNKHKIIWRDTDVFFNEASATTSTGAESSRLEIDLSKNVPATSQICNYQLELKRASSGTSTLDCRISPFGGAGDPTIIYVSVDNTTLNFTFLVFDMEIDTVQKAYIYWTHASDGASTSLIINSYEEEL